MNYIPEATQKHIDDLVKTINKLNKERNKLTAENKAQAKQLILSGVSQKRELLEGFVDWFNINDKTQAILSERIEEYLKTL
jgi:hypothetical protein